MCHCLLFPASGLFSFIINFNVPLFFGGGAFRRMRTADDVRWYCCVDLELWLAGKNGRVSQTAAGRNLVKSHIKTRSI